MDWITLNSVIKLRSAGVIKKRSINRLGSGRGCPCSSTNDPEGPRQLTGARNSGPQHQENAVKRSKVHVGYSGMDPHIDGRAVVAVPTSMD